MKQHTETTVKTAEAKNVMLEKPVYIEYKGVVIELRSPYHFTSIHIEDEGSVWIEREAPNKCVLQGYWYRLYKDGEAKEVSREKYEEIKRKAKQLVFGED